MVDDEDSFLSKKGDASSGPPKVLVVGLPVLGILVTITLILAIVWIWATARAFIVPQSAMAPAIFGGDEIHADATAFGLHLPLIGKVHDGTFPERGDVIVFDWPSDRSLVYVMRVIATAGDEVLVHKDGTVDVRGKQVPRCAMGSWPKGVDPNGTADGRKAFVEWSNDRPYIVLFGKEASTGTQCVEESCVVPRGHLFVLGDNRSASDDSRTWGFVPNDHVIGKVKDARTHDDLAAYQQCIAGKKKKKK